MEHLIHQLLDKNSIKEVLNDIIESQSWEDGRKTAGTHALLEKDNLQLSKKSPIAEKNSKIIIEIIKKDLLIKSFSLPRLIHGLMFTRTSKGQGYGMHVDNAYMSSGRSDLSFTIFLSDPGSYKGGELCIQSLQDNKSIKLPAGQIIIYPSTSLHSVEKVTDGERVVCVGWIQSYIKNHEDRNTLFGLDAGARALLAENGRSPELDLIFQAYGNLLRRLGD